MTEKALSRSVLTYLGAWPGLRLGYHWKSLNAGLIACCRLEQDGEGSTESPGFGKLFALYAALKKAYFGMIPLCNLLTHFPQHLLRACHPL